MEKVFPLFSPNIDKIEVVRKGNVNRAKLYYLRDRTGKRARIADSGRADEVDQYASMIDLKFGFTVHDAGDYFIKTRVSGIEPLASMILNQENLLTTITFGIHDLGYNERFIKYCAKRMERKSENYLDAVMGDFKKIITQMGLTLATTFTIL